MKRRRFDEPSSVRFARGPRYGPPIRLDDPTVARLDGDAAQQVPGQEGWRRVGGLDLGQSRDWTALACLGVRRYDPGFVGPRDKSIHVTKLGRRRRLPYTEIADEVVKLDLDLLVVDFGGVGRAVVDILVERARRTEWKARIVPVNIVKSAAAMSEHHEARGKYFSVPKVDVVESINVAQQERGMRIPDTVSGRLLRKEMQEFRAKKTEAGNDQFAAREGKYDDLVLALGLVCWWTLRFGNRELNLWTPGERVDGRGWK